MQGSEAWLSDWVWSYRWGYQYHSGGSVLSSFFSTQLDVDIIYSWSQFTLCSLYLFLICTDNLSQCSIHFGLTQSFCCWWNVLKKILTLVPCDSLEFSPQTTQKAYIYICVNRSSGFHYAWWSRVELFKLFCSDQECVCVTLKSWK